MNVFREIIKRSIPAHIVAEDSSFMAFLDINPKSIGHTIVISKLEDEDSIFMLPDHHYCSLMLFAKRVSLCLQEILKTKRVAMVVAGFDIAYAHIHLIPANSMSDIDLKKENVKLSDGDMATLAARLKGKFDSK